MSSNSSGKKLEGFFTGKGFYIVLFLCAAVIGVSAWMMAAGNEAMDDLSKANNASFDNKRVETIIIPPEKTAAAEPVSTPLPVIAGDAKTPADTQTQDETEQVWREGDVKPVEVPMYVWPVQGELERTHSTDKLAYDVTMRDWRTHEGIDIEAAIGSTVSASHAGSVESVVDDDFYGTVVTVNHGDGSCTVYANLAELPAVSVGDWVEPGDVIGAVRIRSGYAPALCDLRRRQLRRSADLSPRVITDQKILVRFTACQYFFRYRFFVVVSSSTSTSTHVVLSGV